MTLLETKDLTKVYPGVQEVIAIDKINLTIDHGEFVSIIGPSGSGKSTLMNCLGLLDQATSGKLLYMGEDAVQWKPDRQAHFRNFEIGFIFQAHMLMPEFTALENVLIPLRVNNRLGPETEAYAKELLTRIGLDNRTHHLPGELSGGQNQRVAIARALVNKPKIVFADEPTGALDHKTSHEVYELMREINAEDDVTFVIVTHERELSAKTDRIISILDGKIQTDELQAV